MTTSQQNVTLSLVGHPQDIKRLKAVPPSCDVCRWFLAVKLSKTVQPLHMLHPLPYFYSVKAVIYASMHAFVDRDFNEKYANISTVIGTYAVLATWHAQYHSFKLHKILKSYFQYRKLRLARWRSWLAYWRVIKFTPESNGKLLAARLALEVYNSFMASG